MHSSPGSSAPTRTAAHRFPPRPVTEALPRAVGVATPAPERSLGDRPVTPAAPAGGEGRGDRRHADEGNGLLDVAGGRRPSGGDGHVRAGLVLDRRDRYYKLGKFVPFRPADLDAFVEVGRQEPVAPWVHPRSTARRARTRTTAPNEGPPQRAAAAPGRRGQGCGPLMPDQMAKAVRLGPEVRYQLPEGALSGNRRGRDSAVFAAAT